MSRTVNKRTDATSLRSSWPAENHTAQTQSWPYGLELCLPQLCCLARQKARRRALGLRPEFWLQGQWRPSYTSVCDSCCELFWLDRADNPAAIAGRPRVWRGSWSISRAASQRPAFGGNISAEAEGLRSGATHGESPVRPIAY
jgi:hypothetical protein